MQGLFVIVFYYFDSFAFRLFMQFFTFWLSVICPAGYEPRTLPDDSMTCAPCKFGFYKKTSGGSTVSCVPCPDGRWTLTTGAKSQAKCIGRSKISSISHLFFLSALHTKVHVVCLKKQQQNKQQQQTHNTKHTHSQTELEISVHS